MYDNDEIEQPTPGARIERTFFLPDAVTLDNNTYARVRSLPAFGGYLHAGWTDIPQARRGTPEAGGLHVTVTFVPKA